MDAIHLQNSLLKNPCVIQEIPPRLKEFKEMSTPTQDFTPQQKEDKLFSKRI